MDIVKTGRFIAEVRKERGLTQRELADALCISDKTVSKWETGRGLPEVSLMLPLCGVLGISVNDLLTGERVTPSDYQKKAEENMMDLMQENAENRKQMALAVICGAITIIAVCALTAIASFLELPTIVRVVLIMLAMATAAAGIGAAAVLDRKAGYFECPHCKTLFVPQMDAYIKVYHTFTKRRLTCPVCGQTGMCRRRVTREKQ